MLPVDTKSPSCGSQLGLKAAAKRETSPQNKPPETSQGHADDDFFCFFRNRCETAALRSFPGEVATPKHVGPRGHDLIGAKSRVFERCGLHEGFCISENV